jgi:beta-glucanase (GH16 family)
MKTFTTLALLATSVFASAPNPGSGWKRTLLLDDFTGSANTLPGSNWQIQTGTQYSGGPSNWGTGEVETYTRNTANVRKSGGGNLFITPRKSSSGQWTSGRIESTRSDLACPAGGKMRVEARIMMPGVNSQNGLGYWPSFWMIGGKFRQNRQSWPSVGEIDIMEAVNGQTMVTNALHCVSPPFHT